MYYSVIEVVGLNTTKQNYKMFTVGVFSCLYKALLFIDKMKTLHTENIYFIKEIKK